MTYLATSINESPVITEKAGAAITDPRGKGLKYSSGNVVLCSTAGETVLGIGIMTNDETIASGADVDIQIKDITENFFISSSHFSRVFKKATGYTPKQYLMLNRITYAKELLVHSDLSVGEVARRSGFMDESNCIRYFKREMGTTPNKYRKLMERRQMA